MFDHSYNHHHVRIQVEFLLVFVVLKYIQPLDLLHIQLDIYKYFDDFVRYIVH